MKKQEPAKAEEVKKEDEVVIQNEEEVIDNSQEPSVTVNLEPQKKEEIPEWKKEIDAVKLENEKYKARLEFQARQFEKSQKEFQSYMQNVKKAVNPGETEPVDLDEVAQKDWKEAVRKLAEEETQKILQKQQETYMSQTTALKRQQTLEKSKQEVLEEHPEIMDENSEKAKVYAQIIQEDQDLLSDPYGPVVAMKRMERRLKNPGNANELDRFKRAMAGSTPRGTTPSSKSVTLTREQEQFCKEHGISIEKYARSMKALETGGVTV